jgi:polyhydroxybutyrate depolymerase
VTLFHSWPALVVLAALPCAAADLARGTIEAGGVTRTYTYYAPPRTPGKLPLVIVLHGAGGTGERLAPVTHFDKLAEAKRFLVVYPDGFENHWNDLRGIPEWTAHQKNIDEIAFFNALIDRFVASHNVDPRRFFVTGISNGGLMSHRLGCELAGRIAAIAPVVRTLTVQLAERCAPARPLPALMFFGTADKLVPFEGGIQKMGSAETPVLSAHQTVAKWAALDGCSAQPETTRTANPAGLRITYPGCRSGSEVVACIREGAGHTWPPDATELIWAFFEKHPLRP